MNASGNRKNLRLVEIFDSALLMLHRHCYHVINGIIGNRDYRESVRGGGISLRPNGLGEIPYRPRPIPSG